MNAQAGFDAFVEATRYLFRGPSPQEILLFIVVFSAFLGIVAVPVVYLKIKERQRIKEVFFSRAKDYDLTDEEAELLWKYVRQFTVNPTLVFENKALFEKIVDKVVKNGNPEEIKLTSTIRMKLRFSSIPWFIPLSTTRDIEVYQTGKLVIGNQEVDAYVYDKDEEFLYIALLQPVSVKVGDRIKFYFLRENDARYSLEENVEKIFMEMGRIILAVRHTDKLNRIQFRETVRWKVKIPVKFTILKKEGEETYEGIMEDISVKGARVCYEGSIDVKEGENILLDFTLKGYKFTNLPGKVVHRSVYEKKVCMGVKFEEISRKEEQVIESFIIEEQRKLLRAYKMGEIG